jgi:hypothetical protein
VQSFDKALDIVAVHRHYLAARQSDSAAGLLVKHLILQTYLYQLIDAVVVSDHCAVIAEAGRLAFSADNAFTPVCHRLALSADMYRPLRTYGLASAAACTFRNIYLKLSFESLSLRIVAPLASEMAAFEKYRSPDAVAIMY